MSRNLPDDQKVSALDQVTALQNSDEIYVIQGSDSKKASMQQVGVFTGGGVLTGSGAPGVTPSFVGQRYIDTTGNREYYAVGTASSADWRKTARYAYGTVTCTAGGGSVTVNLDFDWTDGFLKIFQSDSTSEYTDNTTGDTLIIETTYDSLTNVAYTSGHNATHIRDAGASQHIGGNKNATAPGRPNSATSNSFTLAGGAGTTRYVKWVVIA
jgi:hypothetical protein